MIHLDPKHILPAATLASVLFLTACEQSGPPGVEESVLRVHDVSGLQVEELDDKLNELLSRDDLPLRGKVELLDESRLAVNASRHLQDEIAAMIGQLRDHAPSEAIERPFRVEFWLLRMAPGESSEDLPAYLRDELAPLLSQYEGYDLSVEDYLESYHSSQSSIDRISSGKMANIYFGKVSASGSGIVLRANVVSSAPGRSSISYEVNHTLQPGKSLVLGRAHDGGEAEKASYQVLVARAEWTDTAD